MAIIIGSNNDDDLDGTKKDDLIIAGGGEDDIDAGKGDDLVFGGSGDDTIDGGKGSDILFGGSGEDVIDGGKGNDLVFGGTGDDTIDGGSGKDVLFGGSGDDEIDGGAGKDIIFGGSGDDDIDGGKGKDIIYGGSGNDSIDGSEGNDWIAGQSGNDTITGGSGSDDVLAGSGDDIAIYVVGDNLGDQDYYDGSYGTDTLRLVLTQAEATDPGIQADIAAFQAFLLTNSNPSTSSGPLFQFTAFNLTVRDFEALDVVVIGGGNQPPTANPDQNTIVEDAVPDTISGNVLTNDTDPDTPPAGLSVSEVNGNAANVGVAISGAHGTLMLNGDGTYSYQLNNNDPAVDALNVGDQLQDQFTYTVFDGTSSASTTLTIAIEGANDAAVISGTTSGTVDEDAVPNTVSGVLTATDVDNTDNAFQVVGPGAASANGFGTYEVTAAGGWTYTLNNAHPQVDALDPLDTLNDSFTVLSDDGTAQLITITINGSDDAAVVSGTFAGNVTEGDVGDPAETATGSLSISDVDGNDNPFFADQPSTAGDNGFGSFELISGMWTYTLDQAAVQDLDAGDMVDDTTTYVASDGTQQQITVTITGTDDAAIVGGTFSGNVTEGDIGDPAETATGSLSISDVDGDDNPFFADQASTVGDNGLGSFELISGTWTYTLDQAAVQDLDDGVMVDDTTTYVASDGTQKQITVTITGTEDAAAIAGVDTGTVTEDTTLTTSGTLTIVDPDAGEAAFNAAMGIAGTFGSLDISAAGAWTYTLDNALPAVQALAQGAMTIDTIQVSSVDGTTHDIVITLVGSNDGAVITGDTMGDVSEDGTLTDMGVLAAADPDAGESAFDIISGQVGTFGTFNIDSAGNWDYTLDNGLPAVQALAQGATATDSFDVTSIDGTAETVVITVTGTNDGAIIGGDDAGAVTEDTVLSDTGSLSITDTDTNQSEFVAAMGLAGTHGTLDIAADGDWTYTLDNASMAVQQLAALETLNDSVTVSTVDGTTHVVDIVITGTDDNPTVATTIADTSTNEDAAFTLDVSSNFSDIDATDNLTFSATLAGGGLLPPWLMFSSAGVFTGTPTNGDVGTINVTVTASDGSGPTASDTFAIEVINTNDAPTVIAPISDQSISEGESVLIDLNGVFNDVDVGDSLSLSFSGLPSWLTFDPTTNSLSGTTADGDNGTFTIDVTATDTQTADVTDSFDIEVIDIESVDAPDGYISGATVFADADGDRMQDAGEATATTDSDGDFVLVNPLGNLVMEGGVDIASNIAFPGQYLAPAGAGVITPITTVIVEIAELAPPLDDFAAAETALESAFGIAATVDLQNFDQIAGTLSTDPGIAADGAITMTVATQINNMVVQIAGLLDGAGGAGVTRADGIDAGFKAIAAAIDALVSPATLDLLDVPTLQSIISAAATLEGVTLSAADNLGAAEILAASNSNADTAFTSSAGTSLLTALAQTAIVAGDAANTLFDVGVGTTTIAAATTTFVTNYSTEFINALPLVGDVAGNKGTPGADTLTGNALPDILEGLGGDDIIDGAGGNDVLLGGDDNDTISGGDGIDDIQGGDGDDTLIGGDGADSLDGGTGTDIADYSGDPNAVNVDLSLNTATDGFGNTDSLSGIEWVIGSNDATAGDILTGNSQDNTFHGGIGDDVIDGKGGTDTAIYTGTAAQYQITQVGNTITVTSLAGAPDTGTDTLTNVENIQFDAVTFSRPTAIAIDNASVDENASGAIVGNLTVTDDDDTIHTFTTSDARFEVASGQLKLVAGQSLNHEAGSVVAVDVTATDDDGLFFTETFNIAVNNVNDAPSSTAIGNQNTPEDQVFSLDVSGNFSDEDVGDSLSFTATLDNGSALPMWLGISPGGVLSGTPDNGDVGVILVKVTADDGTASSSQTFQLTVDNVNDAPVVQLAIADTATNEDAPFALDISANFADADTIHGDSLAFSATLSDDSPLPSWLAISPGGVLSGTPLNGDVGTIAVKVTATDGSAASVSDIFQLTVNNTNDPAVIFGVDTGSVTEDVTITAAGMLLINDPDVGENTFTAATGLAGSFGTLDITSTGNWTYTLDNANATVQALDSGDTLNDTVTITSIDGTTHDIQITINGTAEGSVIFGTSGDDNLTGTAIADTIEALAGNDQVSGLGGNDQIFGGDGSDNLFGGAGEDTLDGGTGFNRLQGGASDDTLIGGTRGVNIDGNRALFTDATDQLAQSTAILSVDDTLDQITFASSHGFATGEKITYAAGAGVIGGLTDATDYFVIVDDSTTVRLAATQADALAGTSIDLTSTGTGGALDTLNGVRVSLSGALGSTTSQAVGGPSIGTDTLINIDQVFGTSFDDVFTVDATYRSQYTGGNSTFNELDPGAGDDVISGNGSTRISYVGINGFTADGGDGIVDGVTVNLATGEASATNAADAALVGTDVFTGVNAVRGSSFADTLIGSAASFESFRAQAGDDFIDGGAGSGDRIDYRNSPTGVTVNLDVDQDGTTPDAASTDGDGVAMDGYGTTDTFVNIENVRGSEFDDVITGDAGNNRLEGQDGDDDLFGGDGNDFFRGGAGDDLLDGGAGVDRIEYQADRFVGDNTGFQPQTGVTVDLSVETDGVTGDAGSTDGDGVATDPFGDTDTLMGIENVRATDFADTLIGDAGNNQLDGRDDDDIIRAGGGFDFLIGGGGDDTFITQVGDEADTISDFQAGAGTDDVIDVSAFGFESLNGSGLRLIDFASDDGVNTTIDLDQLPGGDQITLNNVLVGQLDASDFIFATANVINGTTGDDNIVGTGAPDTINALDGNDVVDGGFGNDQIFGGDGNDQLLGNAGDDTLDGGVGFNRLQGGAGDDTLIGGTRGVNIDGNRAEYFDATDQLAQSTAILSVDDTLDQITFAGPHGFVTGEQITYVAGGGVIGGLVDGNLYNVIVDDATTIRLAANQGAAVGGVAIDLTSTGSGGALDTLNGIRVTLSGALGSSTSQVLGGPSIGTDSLTNIDQVFGTSFDDVFTVDATYRSQYSGGTATFNEIDPGAGNDVISGNGATRISYVSISNFTADGGDGIIDGVTVNLGAGQATATNVADTALVGLDIFTGVNSVRGSNFADTIIGSNNANFESFRAQGGADFIDGGAGDFDRLDYRNSPMGVTVNLAVDTDGVTADAASTDGDGIASDGFGTTDTFTNIEYVRGSEFDDVITGDGGSNRLEGQDGDDDLFGGEGNDFFRGGAGDDLLDGGAGVDRIEYNTDRFVGDNTGFQPLTGVTVDLSVDTDGVTGDAASNDGDGIAIDPFGDTDTLVGIENVRGTDFDDTLTGDSGDNQLDGRDGSDVIRAGGGFDFLIGGGGDDTFITQVGDGSDTISDFQAGAGTDDTIDVSAFGFESLNGGGLRLIDFASDDGVNTTIDLDQTPGGDELILNNVLVSQLDASDFVFATVNVINGTPGDDVLVGTSGSDTINGLAGNDDISGGFGNDFIFGGDGDDILDGGPGDDTLDGGTGNNTFIGGAGDDTLIGGTRGISGTTGDPSVDANFADYRSATGGIVVNLTGALGTGLSTVTGDASVGNDTLQDIEIIIGTDYGDTYTVDASFVGQFGNFNEFQPGAGDDTITGNATSFTRVGYADALDSVTVDLETQTAQSTNAGDTANIGMDSFTGVVSVRGSAHDDMIFGSNSLSGVEQFRGQAGNDMIDGRGGVRDEADYRNSPNGISADLSGGAIGSGFVDDGYADPLDTAGTGTGFFRDTLSNIERIRGSEFSDTIIMDDGNNRVRAQGGEDHIEGRGGADDLRGGEGNDMIFGGAGDDSIQGEDGSDQIFGGDDSDFIRPGAGDDTVDGGTGGTNFDSVEYDDGTATGPITYTGGIGGAADVVTGDASIGTDTITNVVNIIGTDFGDTFYGGDAAFINLTGRDGDDMFFGGDGDDFITPGAGDDTIDGGVGFFDTVAYNDFENTGGITFTGGIGGAASTVTGDPSVGTDTLTNIEQINGSNFGDTFTGGDFALTINAEDGDDVITGGTGSEFIRMGSGNDTFVATVGGGNDIIDDFQAGAATDDVIDVSAFGFESLNGAGLRLIDFATDDGFDTTIDLDQVPGGDVLSLTNVLVSQLDASDFIFAVPNVINGTIGDDTLVGTGAPDTINALAGNDQVTGSFGNDQIFGGDDDDSLDGGAGDDTIFGGAGTDFIQPGAGDDIVDGGTSVNDNDSVGYQFSGTATGITYTGGTAGNGIAIGDGVVTGDAFVGTDTLTNLEGVQGTNFVDTLTGGDANENLSGVGGDDMIDGGEGSDIIQPGSGDDTVFGGVDLGGTDFDLVQYGFVDAATSALTYTGGTGTNGIAVGDAIVTGASVGTDTLSGIEGIEDTAFADTFNAGTANELFSLFHGGDDLIVMSVGTGSDTISHFQAGAATDDVIDVSAFGFESLNGAGLRLIDFASDNGTDTTIDLDQLPGGDQLVLTNVLVSQLDASDFVFATANVINGTTGDDNLVGTSGADTINALAGNDVVNGGFGNDQIFGGDGSDNLFGGAGEDTLDGGTGFNRLQGGASDDTLIGGTRGVNIDGNRALFTDATDQLAQSTAILSVDDTLDQITFASSHGFATGEKITYAAGAGVIGGLTDATDYFVIVDDPTTVRLAATQADAMAGTSIDLTSTGTGGALDTLNGVRVSLSGALGSTTSQAVGGPSIGTDTLINIDQVFGTSFDDVFTVDATYRSQYTGGNSTFNELDPGAGDDVISGNGSTRISYVGINGFTADGGDGIVDGVTVNLATGEASATNAADAALVGTDVFTGVNAVRGSSFADTLIGSAASFESFRAQAGDDFIDGGAGSGDRIDYRNSPTGVTVNLAVDQDGTTPDAASTDGDGVAMDGYGTTDTFVNIENVRGSEFDDVITGDAGSNRLEGQDGDDDLFGGDGNDFFRGGAGDDLLDGGAGVDRIEYQADRFVGDNTGFQPQTGVTVDLSVETDGVTGDAGSTDGDGVATDPFGDTDTLMGIENVRATDFADTLIGDAGNNQLDGRGDDDIIRAGGGFDFLIGGGGDDTFITQVGDEADTISDFQAGAGTDDVIDVSAFGFESLNGSGLRLIDFASDDGVNTTIDLDQLPGGDQITLNNVLVGQLDASDFIFATANVINGTTGDDNIVGTGAPDTINALDGNDVVNGGFGNDQIFGGDGNDQLLGNAGDDTLDGGVGFNRLQGGAGDDTLIGGTRGVNAIDGNRAIYGDATDELAQSQAVNSVDDGLDQITFAAPHELVTGEKVTYTAGAVVIGGLTDATDYFVIVDDPTTVRLASTQADAIAGTAIDLTSTGTGGALDTLNGIRVELSGALGSTTSQVAGGLTIGTDTLINIDQVFGTSFDDVFTVDGTFQSQYSGGTSTFNEIDPGAGDDVVSGNGSTRISYVSIQGFTETGADSTVDGVTVNLATGEAFATNAGDAGLVGFDVFTGVNAVRGSSFADTLTGSGASFETFRAQAGDDFIDGGAGGGDRIDYRNAPTGVTVNLDVDQDGTTPDAASTDGDGVAMDGYGTTDTFVNIENVRGSEFNDVITGDAGSNRLEGQSGDDDLFGGDGNDFFRGGEGDDLLDGGAGTDRIEYHVDRFNGDNTGFQPQTGITVDLSVDTDGVTGDAGSTDGDGVATDPFGDTDTLMGIENVRATDFADTLTGDAGNNRFEGRSGMDQLDGGAGADQLLGGGDNDTLTGGAGDDLFIFGAGEGADTITDFTAGAATDDVIDVTAFGFTAFDDGSVNDIESALMDSGSDVILDLGGGNQVTIQGVNKANLDSDDFNF